MTVRNLHWYSMNAGIDYPLHDTATAVNDDGDRLPPDIIVDLQLRYPEHLGRYPFLSALSATGKSVTAVFEVTDSLNQPKTLSPLAAVTVVLDESESGRHVALLPQSPGVAGWIVFGSGAYERVWRGKFSGPEKSLLSPRAVRGYRPLPVSSISKLHAATKLTGIVNLRADPPLELVKDTRDIEGVLRDVIVLRMTQKEGENTFESFAGPCGARPESGSCGDPQPLEFINNVAPDCDGTIVLEFEGCAEVAPISDMHGAVVDCRLALGEGCIPKRIPDEDGNLPGEYQPVPLPPDVSESAPSEGSLSVSEEFVDISPYTDNFDNCTARDFTVISGSWVFVFEDSPDEPGTSMSAFIPDDDDLSASSASISQSVPDSAAVNCSYQADDASIRNISLWETPDGSTVRRIVETSLKMKAGPFGAKHNGGIILNHRPHRDVSNYFTYYYASIDYDRQQIVLRRFNGITLATVASADVLGVRLDRWYNLSVSVNPGVRAEQTQIGILVQGVDDPGFAAALGPVIVNDYRPSNGFIGLGTDRAVTTFSFFHIEQT